MEQIQRNHSLDLIRAIAAFCVVLTHVVEGVYLNMTLESMLSMSLGNRLFSIANFTIGRIGVPLFLILSGYLLLARDYDENKIKKFYKHNFLPLLIVWEIWLIVYQIYLCLYNHAAFNFSTYIHQALFLQKNELSHSWYMPMIISMYLFLPYVSIALNKMNPIMLSILLAITYTHLFVVPFISFYHNMQTQLNLQFSGGIYGVYLILGYCLNRYKDIIDKFYRRIHIYIISMFLYIGTVAIQFVRFQHGTALKVWYSFFTMPLLGAFIFLLLNKIPISKSITKFVTRLSTCSFGIYLVHNLICLPCVRYVKNVQNKYFCVIVLSLLIYFCSFIIVELLSKISFFKFIFLKKN